MELSGRQKQCKTCPWKQSVVPSRDVPRYNRAQHEKLAHDMQQGGHQRIMACHKTNEGKERPCVGWLYNQLGPGNNIPLRLKVRGQKFTLDLDTDDQHATFAESLQEECDGGPI